MGLDKMIQSMAIFNADKGATGTPLTLQSYAVETNHLLAVISGAGNRGGYNDGAVGQTVPEEFSAERRKLHDSIQEL